MLLYPILFGIRNFYYILIISVIYLIGLLIGIFTKNMLDNLNYTKYEYILKYLPILFSNSLYVFATFLILIIFGYYSEKVNRINFLKFDKKMADKRKDDEIFDNLVPKFVQQKMKTGDRGVTNDRETVTIIFANIAHFDDLVAKLNPRELVNVLDRIYGAFDKLSSMHGVQKIETVGYTYMAAGGLKDCEKDMDENALYKHHAIRVFELAIDMIDIMSSIVLQNGDKINIKVGMHTGKVLAGVIGEHKPQFSLIGDTVNTAARMGAKVEEMCILMTEECHDFVKEEYEDFDVLEKTFKGKGAMKVFQHDPMKLKRESKNAKMKMFKNFLTKFLARCIQQVGGTDLNLEELLGNKGENKNKELKRKNSIGSNQSDFIIEDENQRITIGDNLFINEFEENMYNMKRNRFTSNSLKTLEYKNTLLVSNTNEVNPLFRDSFFLTSWNETKIEDTKPKGYKELSSQEQYAKYVTQKYYTFYQPTLILNSIYIVASLITILNDSEYNNTVKWNTLCNSLKFIITIVTIVVLIKSKELLKLGKKKNTEILFIVLYLLALSINQIKMSILPREFSLQIATEQNFIIIIMGLNFMIEYKKQIFCCVLSMMIFSMNLIGNKKDYLIIKYSAFSICISLCIFIFIILKEYIGTFDYVKNQQVTTELLEAEKLLFNLMPPHVVISLKEDRTVADVINDVTILYTDICNFTKFSAAQKEQKNIVRMLIELFKRMDNACVELNVYKVHTIGDCFVVLGFTGKVPMNERNIVEEARNVVNTGRKMIDIIRIVRESKEVNFPTLGMRIGIHTGRITAGIIGSNIVRYDIFGVDCLVANMMESEGQEGRVNISEDTKRLLGKYLINIDMDTENKFSYNFNQKVHVPSINREFDSYLVDFTS